MLACDLLVAARDAQFRIPEVKRGLKPAAAGGLMRLPRFIPQRIAMEMALTGDMYSAEFLDRYGLVNRLAEPGQALAEAKVLARRIVKNAPLSLAASKRVLTEQRDWPISEMFTRQVPITAKGPRAPTRVREPRHSRRNAAPFGRGNNVSLRPHWEGPVSVRLIASQRSVLT